MSNISFAVPLVSAVIGAAMSYAVLRATVTKLDRDGTQVTSRLGVSAPAVEVSPEIDLFELAQSRMPLDFVVCDEVQLLAETSVENVLAQAARLKPQVMVIDSIQTVYSDQLTSAPGSVAQVRECAAHLTRAAKASGPRRLGIFHAGFSHRCR